MAIQFACKCGKQYQAREDQAGKKTKCATCGNLLIIPAPGAVAQEKMAMADTIKGERCADCGELFMPHRIVEEKGELLCRTCWTKRKHEEGDLESVKEIPRRGNMAEPSPRNPWIWVGLAAGALVLVALVLVMILR